jgi:opacity protein-like surface antigen
LKKLVIAAVFVALPSIGQAQDGPQNPVYYAEISIGGSFLSPVSTGNFTATDGINTISGRLKADYDPSVVGGAELGEAGFLDMPEVRLGAAYNYIDAHFSKMNFTGTLNGVAENVNFTRSDATAYGIDPDDSAHVITVQAYYSLPLMGAVRPYLGFGIGPAILDNSDTRLALTGTVGFRAAIDQNSYFGVQYRYYDISGPSIAPGVKLGDVASNSVSLVLGYYLN